MKEILIALAAVGALTLAGCQSTPAKPEAQSVKSDASKAVATAQLTPEAQQALAKAEEDVKAAQAKKALWVTAQDALKRAKAAADEKDSAAVIKHAKVASEQAQLGIAQTQYPLTTISK